MAILNNKQIIGTYEVIRLIKENDYCETYRVEDENGTPFFLKLFILKNTPEKMLDENHHVTSIELMSKVEEAPKAVEAVEEAPVAVEEAPVAEETAPEVAPEEEETPAEA